METADIQGALDQIFDHALIYHAFTDYMRDYELVVYVTADPSTGIPPAYLRYVFKYCVEADVRTSVAAEIWTKSLDDRLINYETGRNIDGYVWGVKWQVLYPGAKVVPGSERARRWSKSIGIDFHEIRIETNGHDITLVASELEVSELALGYAPFVVGPSQTTE